MTIIIGSLLLLIGAFMATQNTFSRLPGLIATAGLVLIIVGILK